MKIVIISRVIYPNIAPRPMRATELAKEFARQGHEVTLYALTGRYDYSSFEREFNIKVRSLGKTFFSRVNSDSTYSYTFFDKVLHRFLGRLLEFPDIELAFNVYKTLKKERDIDLLITIAIPYPIHWGAALVKQIKPKVLEKTTWVADCGDPYMGNPGSNKYPYFKFVEKWFNKRVDFLSVPIEEAKGAYFPEFRHKIKVIPQGFRFDNAHLENNFRGNKVPTIIYAGIFYDRFRDPRPFLDFLVSLNIDFRFTIYTRTKQLLDGYSEQLNEKLIIKDYIPREELLVEMSKADFLVNLENNSNKQSPSKLIDYALSTRPILSINSNEELNKSLVLEFLRGNYTNKLVIEDIQRYDIRNVTNSFIKLIKYEI